MASPLGVIGGSTARSAGPGARGDGSGRLASVSSAAAMPPARAARAASSSVLAAEPAAAATQRTHSSSCGPSTSGTASCMLRPAARAASGGGCDRAATTNTLFHPATNSPKSTSPSPAVLAAMSSPKWNTQGRVSRGQRTSLPSVSKAAVSSFAISSSIPARKLYSSSGSRVPDPSASIWVKTAHSAWWVAAVGSGAAGGCGASTGAGGGGGGGAAVSIMGITSIMGIPAAARVPCELPLCTTAGADTINRSIIVATRGF